MIVRRSKKHQRYFDITDPCGLGTNQGELLFLFKDYDICRQNWSLFYFILFLKLVSNKAKLNLQSNVRPIFSYFRPHEAFP